MSGDSGHILIVGGPTASGKSELALDLARKFRGTIINADSMQMYRELRLLTARPSPAEEKIVPHRLYGAIAGRERCSAGRWRSLALSEIDSAQRAGRLPILVGGTGLYFRSLLKGLAPVPDIPQSVRQAATALCADLGVKEIYRRLAERDPEGAAKIHPANIQRVLRAYEVMEATGKSLGHWQAKQTGSADYSGKAVALVIEPAREALYASCDSRTVLIAESGGIEEVATLRGLGLDHSFPVMKALGVRELGAYLDGQVTRAQAEENLSRATRRYAKRQTTWFRHQMPEATRFPACYNAAHKNKARRIVERLLQAI